MSNPLVSVLMPVFNCESYLSEAIASILNQSFTDFEFVIINDGSTDNSEKIILSFDDQRIKYVKNEQNIKLIATLNKGLDLCKGKYIVRMDADDISLPNRIEVLVNFMEVHPTIGVCSSYYETIGANSIIIENPTNHEDIRLSLLFFNPICHPGAIWRTEIFLANSLKFNSKYIHAEEYKLWCQAAKVCDLANISEVLFLYRLHESQVSTYHSVEQNDTAKLIRKELLQDLSGEITDREADLWEQLILQSDSVEFPKETIRLIDRVLKSNLIKHSYNHELLKRKLALRWKNCFIELQQISIREFRLLLLSSITYSYNWTLKQRLLVLFKLKKSFF